MGWGGGRRIPASLPALPLSYCPACSPSSEPPLPPGPHPAPSLRVCSYTWTAEDVAKLVAAKRQAGGATRAERRHLERLRDAAAQAGDEGEAERCAAGWAGWREASWPAGSACLAGWLACWLAGWHVGWRLGCLAPRPWCSALQARAGACMLGSAPGGVRSPAVGCHQSIPPLLPRPTPASCCRRPPFFRLGAHLAELEAQLEAGRGASTDWMADLNRKNADLNFQASLSRQVPFSRPLGGPPLHSVRYLHAPPSAAVSPHQQSCSPPVAPSRPLPTSSPVLLQ